MLCIHNYLHIYRFLCVQKWRSERGLLLLSRVNSFYINQRCHGQVSLQQSLNKGKLSFQPGVLGLHHRPFSTACRSLRSFSGGENQLISVVIHSMVKGQTH